MYRRYTLKQLEDLVRQQIELRDKNDKHTSGDEAENNGVCAVANPETGNP